MASRGGTDKHQAWFERWSKLRKWEKDRFEAHGLAWEEDQHYLARGYLAVNSTVEYQGEPLEIKVIYPSEYPELPPVVESKTVLERHQQPFGGNFCLLERPIDSWPSRDWGAADLIVERLKPLLRDSEEGVEVVRAAEAPMPEPATAQYHYEPGTVVLVPGDLASPSGEGGVFELGPFSRAQDDRYRCVLGKVNDRVSESLLLRVFRPLDRVQGKWKRLKSRPPVGPSGSEVVGWLRREHAELLTPKAPPPPPRKSGRRAGRKGAPAPDLELIGLVFPEERAPDGTEKDAWLFLGIKDGKQGFLLHAQEVSPQERQRRIPDLAGLSEKRVAVIGLGSLGGDVALHLARAGVGALDLIDFDRFEANNAVRHVLGVPAAGIEKRIAMARACIVANPFCNIEAMNLNIGHTYLDQPETPLAMLERLAVNADLVVETTGLHQIELLIGRVTWEQGAPLIACWVTEGSWAGEVIRIVPGETMCMKCFQTEQREGKRLAGDAAPEEQMIPVQGCSHPTVSGAGFDAAETAAITARLTAQTLLRSDSYPSPDWDHATANFRRESTDTEFPRVATEPLPPNEECSRCGQRAG